VVANQVYRWEVVFKEMITLIEGQTYGGQSFLITLENGGLEIEFNSAYALPDDVEAAAQAAIDGIVDGSIKALP
jgi:basic membrane protein A